MVVSPAVAVVAFKADESLHDLCREFGLDLVGRYIVVSFTAFSLSFFTSFFGPNIEILPLSSSPMFGILGGAGI